MTFGGVRLYRPRNESDRLFRWESQEHLHSRFSPGMYTERDEINAIIHHQWEFCDSRLRAIVPAIASRHLMTFVLHQYDLTAEIERKFKSGQLDRQQRVSWSRIGPVCRRGAKFLAETITMLAPDEAPIAARQELSALLDQAWIYCEELVALSSASTQTFAIFPEASTLEIHAPGHMYSSTLKIENEAIYDELQERTRCDLLHRAQFIDESQIVYNRARVEQLLDPAMRDACGFTCSEALNFSRSMIEHVNVPADGPPIPFVNLQDILEGIQADLGLSEEVAVLMMEGLSLPRNKMQAEPRVVWKPKQEYRALFRPFFQFPHATGIHLVWSSEMAKESLSFLFACLVHRHLPCEWLLGNVREALEKYAAGANREFENVVIRRLKEDGISAARFAKTIGRGEARLPIPSDVGEIDCLGFLPREEILIIGECKMVKPSNEPVTFRDDLDKFLGGKKNYVQQLHKKTEWVRRHIRQVCEALATEQGFPDDITASSLAPVIITYYPTIASMFIYDFPCVSLPELMTAYQQQRKWPYPTDNLL